MVMTSRQGPRDIDCISFSVYFFAIRLHIVRFRMCSSSSLRLSEESKEPEESEEIEEDLEDSDYSEMNYISEIEMDAYRHEASASANPFDNSHLEEDLF